MADPGEEYKELLQFCESDRQKEVMNALAEHGTEAKAAKHLGVSREAVGQIKRRIKARAAKKGWSPNHDMTRTVPDGYLVKGVSTLYGKEGGISAQWVKSTVDRDRQEELMRIAFAAMASELPPVEPVAGPDETDANLCNFFPLTDLHVGMLSWDRETGADWDLDIADRIISGAWELAIDRAPKAERSIVACMGDLIHWDSPLAAVTPSSGHPLDVDSRFPKVVEAIVRMLRRIVESALKHHKQVDLLSMEGNHDPAASIWLRVMLQALYENEPRVIVHDTVSPYYCLAHGDTMVGVHHGHLRGIKGANAAQLALLFANTPEWAATKHRYVHVGHLHSEAVTEVPGCTLEQHQTLAAPDAHTARGGWRSRRGMRVITYSREFGQVGESNITPEMVR